MTSPERPAPDLPYVVPAAGPPGRSRRKVLHIGIDGVNAVDMLDHAATPHLDGLVAEGVIGVSQPYGPDVAAIESGPGWCTIATGVWPDRHGVVDNTFAGARFDAYPDWLTRLEQADPGYSTYCITNWAPLGVPGGPGPVFSSAIDVNLAFEAMDVPGGYLAGDSTTTATTAGWLRDQDSDAHFVYIGNVDIVGHVFGSGPEVPIYIRAIEKADRQVGALLAAMRDRPTYADEDWLVLVSTDHGHRSGGGHGGASEAERTVWLIAAGGDVPRGGGPGGPPQMVDAAATALAHLGVAIDPAWGLDGVPVGAARSAERRRPEPYSTSPVGWVAEHVRAYLDSDGQDGHRYSGQDTLLLTTRGRRTGARRRTPLIYGRSGDAYVVVGSNGGHATHPAWYLNLVADPEVAVQVGAHRFTARARTAGPGERPALWALMAGQFGQYERYAATAGREIPVVVIEPA